MLKITDLTNQSESELLSVVNRILARPGDDFTETELDELTAINTELRRRNAPTLRHHAALTLLPVVIKQHRERHEAKKARVEDAKHAAHVRWHERHRNN